MERKNNKQTFITLCVILVIGIGYIYQMAPSPVLGQLKDRYGIGNEALLNLAVSIGGQYRKGCIRGRIQGEADKGI